MNDYHVEVSGFITSLYLCRSLGVFSKFPPSRAYRCSTGDNIFWRGWLMCSASLCLSLGGGGGRLLASEMSPLTHTNTNARRIAAHNLIHCLFSSSHPSLFCLPLTSLSPSFFSVLCALFCPLFSLRLLNWNNGQSCKYLWIFPGSISKDWHLHKMSCLYSAASFFLCRHSLCFSLSLYTLNDHLDHVHISLHTFCLWAEKRPLAWLCYPSLLKLGHLKWIPLACLICRPSWSN